MPGVEPEDGDFIDDDDDELDDEALEEDMDGVYVVGKHVHIWIWKMRMWV